MAIYASQDLEVTDDGDLVISDFGDLKIASPLRTIAQGIDWIILTNKGELLSDPSFGANIQSFYGDPNTDEAHRMMELSIIEQARTQGLIDLADIDVDVIPVDTDEASIIVEIKGSFLDTESAEGAYQKLIDSFDGLVRGYIYPFTSGKIVPISEHNHD